MENCWGSELTGGCGCGAAVVALVAVVAGVGMLFARLGGAVVVLWAVGAFGVDEGGRPGDPVQPATTSVAAMAATRTRAPFRTGFTRSSAGACGGWSGPHPW